MNTTVENFIETVAFRVADLFIKAADALTDRPGLVLVGPALFVLIALCLLRLVGWKGEGR